VSGFSIERDDASAEFFDAAAAGRLLIRRCPVCSRALAPQALRCADSDVLEWVEASGDAALVTWAVDHVAPLAPVLASPDGATSVFGYVELEEGPWLQVPLVGADPGALAAGIALRVQFVRPGDGEVLPAFGPA
jgi:hypothetical protein